jgi:hypothetical protein
VNERTEGDEEKINRMNHSMLFLSMLQSTRDQVQQISRNNAFFRKIKTPAAKKGDKAKSEICLFVEQLQHSM